MGRGQKRPIEAISGLYSAIPICVLDSAAFTLLSYPAKALLLEVMRQHNGSNNGHLHLTLSWLKTRGWNSNSVINRAREELLKHKLLIRTRLGGLNMGASQYALTWLSISNFMGLDIKSKDYHKGLWAMMDGLPCPKIGESDPTKGTVNTPSRDSTAPLAGVELSSTVP